MFGIYIIVLVDYMDDMLIMGKFMDGGDLRSYKEASSKSVHLKGAKHILDVYEETMDSLISWSIHNNDA